MSKCYKTGGCGCYEDRACNECPASKKEYLLKDNDIDIYVSVLNGEVKDNYMSIAFSEKESIQKVIDAYFKETGHTVAELEECDVYVTTTPFINGKTINVD